eukprot:1571854-Prymnesium_polylepis.1
MAGVGQPGRLRGSIRGGSNGAELTCRRGRRRRSAPCPRPPLPAAAVARPPLPAAVVAAAAAAAAAAVEAVEA